MSYVTFSSLGPETQLRYFQEHKNRTEGVSIAEITLPLDGDNLDKGVMSSTDGRTSLRKFQIQKFING